MNILAGISMAAAGIGALRKAFGAPPKEMSPEFYRVQKKLEEEAEKRERRPELTRQALQAPHATRPMVRPRGAGGRALQEEFRFSRGQLRTKQDPALVEVSSFSDLVDLYRKYGYPAEKGDVLHPWELTPQEREATIQLRAAKEWKKMVEAERKLLQQRTTGKGPAYQAPPEEGLSPIWDIFNGVFLVGRANVARANATVYVQDEKGRTELVSRASIPSAQKDVDTFTREYGKVVAALKEETRRIQVDTGKDLNELSDSDLRDPRIAASFGRAQALIERSNKLADAVDDAQMKLDAFRTAQVARRSESLAKALTAASRSGGRYTVLVPGVLKAEKGTERKSVRDINSFRSEIARISSEGMSPEALKAEREMRFREVQGDLAERRAAGSERERIQPGRQVREYVPERRRGKGTDGMDAAAGIMAPEIAIVDGLGGAGEATLGLGSLVLIGAGAFLIYRVFQSSASKATA